jgi:hypothetical protein
VNPSTALPTGRGLQLPLVVFPPMFNFSANHLLLLSRTECRSCAVFLMQDRSTRRVYRLYDFTKSLALEAHVFYCVAGKVNSAGKLYLVIESVKRDTKHAWSSTAHALVDGAEDSAMF